MERLTKSPRLNYLLGQMGIFTPAQVINYNVKGKIKARNNVLASYIHK